MFGLRNGGFSVKFRLLKAKLKLLKWPLELDKKDVDLKTRLPVNEKSKKYKYSFRFFRYWWASCAIHDEIKKIDRVPVVVDAGCERGLTKRFFRAGKNIKWIGLDWNISRPELVKIEYDELFKCNFDQRLPLADDSVDIVVFLHVLEHLPRPDFTMREIQRILRPGGLVLVGVPVKPRLIALVREKYFYWQLAKGRRKKGRHINCFWPDRLRTLAHKSGFRTELMSGGYFLRAKINPFENYAWWMRINQIFGILFPSMGQEICYSARLIDKMPDMPASGIVSPRGFFNLKLNRTMAWATSLAACIMVVSLFMFNTRQQANIVECKATHLILSHQDGDDVFYVTRCAGIANGHNLENVNIIDDVSKEHLSRINASSPHIRDIHFIIPFDKIVGIIRNFGSSEKCVGNN